MKKFDPVDADDADDEGPNPIPDDDGNVVLRRAAKQGGKRAKGKDKPGRGR